MRLKIFAVIVSFIVSFGLWIGCEREATKSDNIMEITSFTLIVNVKSSNGAVIEDAAVVLNVPVSERVTINDISYNKFTRYRTDSSGKVTISNLPTKDSDGDTIKYNVSIYKSGYTSTSKDIGVITQEIVSIETNIIPQTGATDIKLALLDYEISYRASDFLTRNELLFTDITGKLETTDLSPYKTVALGYDASKSIDYVNQFVAQKTKLLKFVENGGRLFFFQQNDAGWDSTFFPVSLPLADEALGNDLASGNILDSTHILVKNMTDNDINPIGTDTVAWTYTEPGQLEVKHKIAFDVINKTTTGWNGIIATPSKTLKEKDSKGNIIPPHKYWISAELRHGSGKIFLCQGAYYQATYGNTSDNKAKKMTANIVNYLKSQ
jgi:hypothetical protein